MNKTNIVRLLALLGIIVPLAWDFIKNDNVLVYEYKIISLLVETSPYGDSILEVFKRADLPDKRLQIRVRNLGFKPVDNIEVFITVPGKYINVSSTEPSGKFKWSFESVSEDNKIRGIKKSIDVGKESRVDVYFSSNELIDIAGSELVDFESRVKMLDDIDNSWLFYHTWPITIWAFGLIFGVFGLVKILLFIEKWLY